MSVPLLDIISLLYAHFNHKIYSLHTSIYTVKPALRDPLKGLKNCSLLKHLVS